MSDEYVGRSGSWEPIGECPFCLLTASTAINNNVPMPMAEVRGKRFNGQPDVWIKCECLGRPVSLAEEQLRRHERDHGAVKNDHRYAGLHRVIWEESWGKRDKNAPNQSEATGKAKDRGVGGVTGYRIEQEWQAYAEPDKTIYRDTLNQTLNLSLPNWAVTELESKSFERGQTPASYLRELMYSGGIPDDIQKLRRKHRRRMAFKVCQHQLDCIKVIQHAFPEKRSRSEIVVAILVKHWAQLKKPKRNLKKMSKKRRKKS